MSPAGAGSCDVVITGAGLIASLGVDRRQVWLRICAGESGIGALTVLEQSPLDPKTGGQAMPLDPTFAADLPREARYLASAIDQAVREAKLTESIAGGSQRAAPRIGLVFGTTLHGMRGAGRFLREQTYDALRQFLAPAVLRAAWGDRPATGLAITTCSACSSGLAAVGLAKMLLKSGDFDAIICGGYDPISEYAYAGFGSLRLIAAGPVRPFCRDREGMKLGEGYAAVVLERGSDAKARGIEPLVHIAGYGESADAHHLTQPRPDGDGAARAIRAALAEARLEPADVDLIAAHATGTPDNDRGEHAALRSVFGDGLGRTPVVAFKSALGHTLGGAGAVELVLSMMALTEGMVPPTAGASADSLEFEEIQLASTARPAPLKVSINTSIGFGGANACIVLRKPAGEGAAEPAGRAEPAKPAQPPGHRDVFITGVGVVLPSAVGNAAFIKRLGEPTPGPGQDAAPIDDAEFEELISARRVRRMSAYVKLSLAATREALRDAGVLDDADFAAGCCAILGSAHGSTGYSADYYREIVAGGIEAANPMLFAEGVPNAAAAHISMAFGIKGGCQTILGSRTSGLDALRLAAMRIATGEWDRAVVSAAEELSPLVNSAYASCGLHHAGRGASPPFSTGAGFASGCGAVTLIVESEASLRARLRAPTEPGRGRRARIDGWASAAIDLRGDGRAMASQARRIGAAIAGAGSVICSANGTSIDRLELAVLAGCDVEVTSLCGHIAETFSVTPLAAIASVLLTKRLPPLLHDGRPLPAPLRAVSVDSRPRAFAVLAADYSGAIAAARVTPLECP